MIGGDQLKYKKLVSAGCSFIQGSELGDEVPYSKNTYPALLAKHYNLDYDCIAYPSASNQGIAKKIFDYKNIQECLFVVQWTFPSRLGVDLSYNYFDKNKNKTNWFDLAPNNWDLIDHFHEYREYTQQLKDLGIDKLSNTIYNYAHVQGVITYIVNQKDFNSVALNVFWQNINLNMPLSTRL